MVPLSVPQGSVRNSRPHPLGHQNLHLHEVLGWSACIRDHEAAQWERDAQVAGCPVGRGNGSLELVGGGLPSPYWLSAGAPAHTRNKTASREKARWLLASDCSGQALSSVQFCPSVVLNSFQPHVLQHARLPCPSPTPGVYSDSCPLGRWYHPTISSSAIPFSRLQSFPGSGSFPRSRFFASGGQSVVVSASSSVLPMNVQDWFPLGWTGWLSLLSKGPLRVFSNTTVQKHQFFRQARPHFKASSLRLLKGSS